MGAHPGLHGGWLATMHIYPSDMAQNFWTALLALAASLLVTVLVSLATAPRPEAELAGLVYSLTPRPRTRLVWWKRPEALAVAILLAAIALNLFLA
jgi:SSS family solute:Na+ symporter